MPRQSKFLLKTDRQVLGAPPPANSSDRAQYRIKGAPGLVLRVTRSGAKSWGLWVQDARTRRWKMLTIGTYPRMSLAIACAEWRRQGDDTQSLEGSAPRNSPVTIRALGQVYLDRHAKPNKRSWREDERVLVRDVYPKIGSLMPGKLLRTDVVEVLNEIHDRGAPVSANRTLALIRKMLNWAVSEGYMETNPAQGVGKRAKEEARTRVLSVAEISCFWRALEEGVFEEATADVLRLQLLLGARVREITGMAREELNLSGSIPIWTVPRSRTKAGRALVRPLPPLAFDIVRRRVELAGENARYIFPSATSESKPGTPRAPANALRRAGASGCDLLGAEYLTPARIADWKRNSFTPHDLRRTCRTYLAELGVSETVAKKILGHAPPKSDVTASVYDQHTYLPEMHAALLAWEQRLLGIVGSAQPSSPGMRKAA